MPTVLDRARQCNVNGDKEKSKPTTARSKSAVWIQTMRAASEALYQLAGRR